MTAAAIELRGICASYGRLRVLHDVNLTVRTGQICALLGPNGAGKTTLIDVIAGLHRADSGQLILSGANVTETSATRLARNGLCTVPQGRGIFPSLTISENLWIATRRGASRREAEDSAYNRFPALKSRRRTIAGLLSGGEQQMLAIARALVAEPAYLLLDELSTGLAPRIVEELYQHVASLAADGVTVVLVEQFARAVLPIANTAAILVNGHLAMTTTELALERLHEAYLAGNLSAFADDEELADS
jgi:branched-chain amino acid transport system ATP-binding protein